MGFWRVGVGVDVVVGGVFEVVEGSMRAGESGSGVSLLFGWVLVELGQM